MEKRKQIHLEKCDGLITKNTNVLIRTENSKQLVELLHNGEKQYQTNESIERCQNKRNLQVHKSFHAINFKCTTCGDQFLEWNGLKNHLTSHINIYKKLLESKFVEQQCNDVGECNSNLCNNFTTCKQGLKTKNFESEGPIQKGIIHQVKLEISVEFEQTNIENILSTKDCSINSENCVDSYLTVENADISCDPVNHEHRLAKSYNASLVDQKEYKNNKVYECAKCSMLFDDRSSIRDHLKHRKDYCINCCKYTGGQRTRRPVCFQPGRVIYFECEECFNGFYTLKSFGKYLSEQSKKEKDRPYKCEFCPKTHINLHHFAAHQRLHKGERPYQCNICNKYFHARFNLEAHMFLHQNIKRFECYFCSKKFLKLSYLKIHMLSHDSSKHKCNICGKEFESLNSLQKHQDVHSKNKPHKCSECSMSFTLLKSFKEHLKGHGSKPFKCFLCDESCSTYFELMCHKREHKDKMPYKCDICGDLFDHLTDWEKHKEIHNDNKMFECNKCHKKFINKTGVKKHLQTHFKKIENLRCKVCDKKFSTQDYLNQHIIKNHKELKQFICNLCKKTFILHSDFSSHLNQHSGKPYNCEFCGKGYKINRSLQKHTKIDHTCSICDKLYSNSEELEAHRTIHKDSKLKQYACELCDKKYTILSVLRMHKLSHVVKKPFKCNFCYKSFINITALSFHKIKHTGESHKDYVIRNTPKFFH